MQITLKAVKNLDFAGGTPYGGPIPPAEVRAVPTIEMGIKVMRAWIEANELGGGNMPTVCGQIHDDGKLIGRVSYNGRFWPVEA